MGGNHSQYLENVLNRYESYTYQWQLMMVHPRESTEFEDLIEKGRVVTSGGRVLCATALGLTVGEAKAKAVAEEYGDETAFAFAPEGELIGLARSLAGRNACVCRSAPPHETWTRTELDRYVGGPMLANWQGHWLVGGRKTFGGCPAVTTLYWLENDRLVEIMELPSGGDNSYTGFVELEPGRALVSYYSSHETAGPEEANIYLAELRLTTCPSKP